MAQSVGEWLKGTWQKIDAFQKNEKDLPDILAQLHMYVELHKKTGYNTTIPTTEYFLFSMLLET